MATVAIVGAGMGWLICGLKLQEMDHRVIWLEKLRGVGGRLATRRLAQGCVDHGVHYWSPHWQGLQSLTRQLLQQRVVHQWSAQGFTWQRYLEPIAQTVYCTDNGVNAISKYMVQNLDIRQYSA